MEVYTGVINTAANSRRYKEANFPCAGTIKNVLLLAEMQEDSEFLINFGPRVPDTTLLTANSAILVAKPGRPMENGFEIRGKFQDPAVDAGEVVDTAGLVHLVGFHPGDFDVKKYETWFLSTMFESNDYASNRVALQYDFIPDYNAAYHDSWRLNAIAENANYQNQYNFPVGLRKVKIHVEAYIGKGAGATEIQALLVLKLIKSGNDVPVGLSNVSEFGRSTQDIAEILITNEETNVHEAFIPYLSAGDRLAYDLIIYTGTLDESSMNVEIEGYVNEKQKAVYRSYNSPYVIDISESMQ